MVSSSRMLFMRDFTDWLIVLLGWFNCKYPIGEKRIFHAASPLGFSPSKISNKHLRGVAPLRCPLDVLDGSFINV
jgi:hypothetical protein